MLTQESNVTFTSKDFLKEFTRHDIEKPVTRLFCSKCGTSIGVNKNPFRPNVIIIKVGTLDDPSIFKPQAAQFIADAQDFHHIPEIFLLFPAEHFNLMLDFLARIRTTVNVNCTSTYIVWT